ncbi:uncharacterized protein V1518DRAFT_410740 [Limtongia smithiae]|uniref:uncharacterized protein n=1 Tax=Limtongia smithiae TaxID=1125753 RepID=UPI0034CDB1E0
MPPDTAGASTARSHCRRVAVLVLLISLVNVNLNYPLYEPRRYASSAGGVLVEKRYIISEPTGIEPGRIPVADHGHHAIAALPVLEPLNITLNASSIFANATAANSTATLATSALLPITQTTDSQSRTRRSALARVIVPLSIMGAFGLAALCIVAYYNVTGRAVDTWADAFCNALKRRRLSPSVGTPRTWTDDGYPTPSTGDGDGGAIAALKGGRVQVTSAQAEEEMEYILPDGDLGTVRRDLFSDKDFTRCVYSEAEKKDETKAAEHETMAEKGGEE